MQIVAKMLRAFSKNDLTNIEIAPSPVVRFALKPSQVGFHMIRTGSDGVREGSRKILWPENGWFAGFENVPHSPISCARSMIFLLFARCRF